MMIFTSPWSSCSRRSPWLPCSGHTISSTGPSVFFYIWCFQFHTHGILRLNKSFFFIGWNQFHTQTFEAKPVKKPPIRKYQEIEDETQTSGGSTSSTDYQKKKVKSDININFNTLNTSIAFQWQFCFGPSCCAFTHTMFLLHNLPSLPNPSPHNCATYGFPATFNFYLKYYGPAGLAGLGFSICSLFSPNQSTTSAFEVSNKSSTFIHEFLFLFGFVYPSCEYVTVHHFHGKLPFDCLMNLLLLSTCNSPFLQTQSSC